MVKVSDIPWLGAYSDGELLKFSGMSVCRSANVDTEVGRPVVYSLREGVLTAPVACMDQTAAGHRLHARLGCM